MNDTISEILREYLARQRAAANRTVLHLLGPTDGACKAVLAAGGVVAGRGYDAWCHTDTCSHASHSAGQAWEDFEVPQSWLEAKDAGPDVWDYCREEWDRPVAVVPTDPPVLLLQRRESRHFADYTEAVRLLPVAAALVAVADAVAR
jgi:hypothetical protein